MTFSNIYKRMQLYFVAEDVMETKLLYVLAFLFSVSINMSNRHNPPHKMNILEMQHMGKKNTKMIFYVNITIS